MGNDWKKNKSKPKQDNFRNKRGDQGALDKLVSKKNPLYAYKIFDNRDKPLIGTSGTSKVILHSERVFENVIQALGSIKTKVTDVTRGNINEGKNIVKYKTMSLINFDESLSEYNIFSTQPITTGIFDVNNNDIFTYEDENGQYERDEISNKVFKSGNNINITSINTLDIFREQNIYFEVFNSTDEIDFTLKDYSIDAIGVRLPVTTGIGKVSARGLSDNTEEEIDLTINPTLTTAKLYLSKFSILDSKRFDMMEQYNNPLVQLDVLESEKWVDNDQLKTHFDDNIEDDKSIMNLLLGLICLKHFQDRRYQDVQRDAQGNITDTIRGFSLSDANKFPDEEINDKFIEYWLTNIKDEKNLAKAYGYVAMLSEYIVSSYTFKKGQNNYGQLWRFNLSYVYDDKLKIINDFTSSVQLKLLSDVLKFEQVQTGDPNVKQIKITGIKDKYLSISKTIMSSDLFGIKIESMDDQLKESDISQYIGQNKPNQDNKYFALQPVKDYDTLKNIYKPKGTKIKSINDKETRSSIVSHSSDWLVKMLITNFGSASDVSTDQVESILWRIGDTIGFGHIELASLKGIDYLSAIRMLFYGGTQIEFYSLFPKNGKRIDDATKIMKVFIDFLRSNDKIQNVPKSQDYIIEKKYNTGVYLLSQKDGKRWDLNTSDNIKAFVQYITNTGLNNVNIPRDYVWYFEETYDIKYINDVFSNRYIGINTEQEYKDNQLDINNNSTYEVWFDFNDKHKGTIKKIKNFRIWTKGGGNISYIKKYSYTDADGKNVERKKEYQYKLTATHSFEDALTEIYDD